MKYGEVWQDPDDGEIVMVVASHDDSNTGGEFLILVAGRGAASVCAAGQIVIRYGDLSPYSGEKDWVRVDG